MSTRLTQAVSLLGACALGFAIRHMLGEPASAPMIDAREPASREACAPAAPDGERAEAIARLSTLLHRPPPFDPAPPSPDDTIEQALRDQVEGQPAHSPLSDAVNLLQADASARRALLQEVAAEDDPELRRDMINLLAFVDARDVESAAVTMMQARDARRRRDGFELVRHHASRETTQRIVRALSDEDDPDVLSSALASITYGPTPSTAQRKATLERVTDLVGHDAADVRANSLMAVARLDRAGHASSILVRGLGDSEPEVQRAAMSGLVEAHVRSDEAKQQLMALAQNDAADDGLRAQARGVLDDFELDSAEQDALAAAVDSL